MARGLQIESKSPGNRKILLYRVRVASLPSMASATLVHPCTSDVHDIPAGDTNGKPDPDECKGKINNIINT